MREDLLPQSPPEVGSHVEDSVLVDLRRAQHVVRLHLSVPAEPAEGDPRVVLQHGGPVPPVSDPRVLKSKRHSLRF